MSDEIWILGATGRSGRGIARRLVASGHRVVVTGRDETRLRALANELGGVSQVVGSLESVLARVTDVAPAVVVNTIGPFTRTVSSVLDACPPGTHYVDIDNELPGIQAVLDRHDAAVASGSTLVAGAGFGVLATESAVLRACEGRPTPARVRVDAIPSLASAGGVVGEALAGSMLDNAPDGGRRVTGGRLVRAGIASAREQLTTPNGDVVTTSLLPTGDLLAAWRASGAADVVSGSSEIPSGAPARALFPVLSVLLRWGALRRFAVGRLARAPLPARERPREFSWGHARVEWDDGATRDVWLRLGDAQDFYEQVAAEVARRLLGDVAPGAYTPGALFGATLATDVGADFVE